jgi:hypothetical protein
MTPSWNLDLRKLIYEFGQENKLNWGQLASFFAVITIDALKHSKLPAENCNEFIEDMKKIYVNTFVD